MHYYIGRTDDPEKMRTEYEQIEYETLSEAIREALKRSLSDGGIEFAMEVWDYEGSTRCITYGDQIYIPVPREMFE